MTPSQTGDFVSTSVFHEVMIIRSVKFNVFHFSKLKEFKVIHTQCFTNVKKS